MAFVSITRSRRKNNGGMDTMTCSNLIDSLFDSDGEERKKLLGVDLVEILYLYQHDYDEVDAFYHDYEVLGGE